MKRLLLCLALLGIFIVAFKDSPLVVPAGDYTSERIAASGGNVQVLSELMFSEYILPFEMTSVLLLAAIIGAVAIGAIIGLSGGNNDNSSTVSPTR